MPSSKQWALFVALGVALIVLGFIACVDAISVTLVSTIFIGVLMIIAGAMQCAHGFAVRDWGGFLFSLLFGLLYIAAGAMIIEEPITGSVIITLFVAACFVVVGIMRCILAIQYRSLPGWSLVLAGGVISLAVGLCLYWTLPWSGLWLIGTFVGIELIASGFGWLQFGLALRQPAGQNTAPARNP
ncbi:HdeD family acid-resistance protein [Acetobacter farinalis]|uniref:HdeD family acid-resistance protein n=1 Tax=Acetobacter farinalis TaxID=1260984 RepID=A0ABT3Q4R6_9PROT|nr:HdeD family acid-resistance protein [Acetobacter farinalis]MCX2560221.1 HdeD family acid-resistance protein [Acetobacter farinalis]NHO28877.1 HdeD family acid-resistance protein [Acetobacter farinalis]